MTTSTDKLTIANVKARLASPTPQIFITLRKILLTIGGIGSAVLLSTIGLPITLPAIVTTIAGYCIVAGAVGSGMATLTSTTPNNSLSLSETKQP